VTKSATKRAAVRTPAVRKSVLKPAPPPVRRQTTASPLMALHEGVVYGPVRSRRLGRSLGINLTPANTKLCSFNCTYCQYGWSQPSRGEDRRSLERWPSPQVVVRAVSRALRTFAAKGESIDRLTLAGHGEPTMHPRFAEVVDALRVLRDKVVPGVPIAVLSNASTLERGDVRSALATIDERYMKLDAGDTKLLRTVNGSTMPVETIIQGLVALKHIVVQAMFVKDRTGRIDNATDLSVINWVVALQQIKPAAVHIYTIDRAPAWPYLQAVSVARLQEIANQVRRAGFPCEVFARSEHISRPVNE
jgi:wyosine [tRNA(Phe)-imidazoG37] synthetase (radical SAM superfamily)